MVEEHNTYKLTFHERKDFDFVNVNLNTCQIIDEALKRGIKAGFVLGKYLELEYKGKKALFHISDNTSLSYLAQRISISKMDTKVFLQRAGIKVPIGKRFLVSIAEIKEYVKRFEKAVVKPDCGSEGRDVYCGVSSTNIDAVVKKIRKKHSRLVVEEQVPGSFFRFTTTIKGFVAVTRKRPASVLGDGEKNIESLIEEKNTDRQIKNEFPRLSPFYEINLDVIAQDYLNAQGLSIDYIPKKGERIFLRQNANTSTGGDSIAISPEDVHPLYKEIAVNALRAVPGMSYAGVDIMTEDVSEVPKDYAVLELNNMPGLISPTYPYLGPSQNVAGAFLDLVF